MDADRADRVLGSLRQTGVRLAIDDFGTGYSSLSRLRGLPLDTLKIDRAFVSDVPSSTDAGALVRSIVALADSLGLSTLAEGVETEAQREYLLQQGCAMAAGWLWSRALPASELTDQLERRATKLSRT
jgi:sensor c-di-GMP phosphodiesterase-like protein